MTSHPTRLGAAVATLYLILATSACSEPAAGDAVTAADGVSYDLSPQQGGRVTTEKVDDIAALVPPAIRARGTLQVSGEVGAVPPLDFFATDNHTAVGSEVDVATLVADVLGLRVEHHNYDWAQNFVKVDSGETDLFMSNVTVTEERKDKYDFATYRLDNVALQTPKDSDWVFRDRTDIAGRKIGVGSGTNQEQLLVEWNARNVAEGLSPADILYFQNDSDYYLALSSRRLDGYLGPNPTALYHAATAKDSKIIATFSGAGDALQGEIAAMTKKGNGLIDAVAKAINHTIQNGTYARALARWGLANEAVQTSVINPTGLPRGS